MKKNQRIFVWGMVLFFVAVQQNLCATLHFDTLSSTIKIASGAKLNVHTDGLVVDGTLALDQGAIVAGEKIQFAGGILEQDGVSGMLVGSYSSPARTSDPLLKMSGGSLFSCEPGYVIPGIEISGTGNRLEGQPLFTRSVIMDENSTLTIAIQSVLNKNIEMALGSTLILDDNLTLADGVEITGLGTINLNNRLLLYDGAGRIYFSSDERALLSGNVTININLTSNLFVDPLQVIMIAGNVTIDAAGSALTFSQAPGPQFIVGDGMTVTLQNIVLSNLQSNTFMFGRNSHICFGENVTLEFSEDITFASNTFGLSIAPLLQVTGNILNVRGLGGKHLISFVTPKAAISRKQIKQRPIALGDHTICFENIECVGLDTSILTPGIDADGKLPENPKIELIGNASLALRGKKNNEDNPKEQPKTAFSLFVKGEQNTLVLLRDGIDFGGSVAYGLPDGSCLQTNELHVAFAISENLQNLATERTVTSTTVKVKENYPYLTLSGNGFRVVCPETTTGAAGVAQLFFDNDCAAVEIENSTAFQLGSGAQFNYHNLQILSNNILQTSANVSIVGDYLEGWDFVLAPGLPHGAGGGSPAAEGLVWLMAKGSDGVDHRRGQVDDFDFNSDALLRMVEDDDYIMVNAENTEVLRALSVPAHFDRPTIFDSCEKLLIPFVGNLCYENSTIKNFSTDASYDFNLVLGSGNNISLATKNMQIYNANQMINVRGTGNVINVSKTLTIDNNLQFAQGAELTFNFVQGAGSNPEVVFASNCTIDLEKDVVLRFQGPGKVIFSDGSIVRYNGAKTVNKRTGVEVVSNKPTFILTDNAVLDFVSGALVNFTGVGTLLITNGAMIAPSLPGSLVIGNPLTALDDIDVSVLNDGEIRLETLATAAEDRRRISLQNVTTSLVFEHGGILTVGNNGLFEVNLDGAALKPGRVRKISFGHNGQFFIKGTGIFALAASRVVNMSNGVMWNDQQVNRGIEYPLQWIGSQSRMGGAGKVLYYTSAASSGGIFNPLNPTVATDITSITAAQLAQLLIS